MTHFYNNNNFHMCFTCAFPELHYKKIWEFKIKHSTQFTQILLLLEPLKLPNVSLCVIQTSNHAFVWHLPCCGSLEGPLAEMFWVLVVIHISTSVVSEALSTLYHNAAFQEQSTIWKLKYNPNRKEPLYFAVFKSVILCLYRALLWPFIIHKHLLFTVL